MKAIAKTLFLGTAVLIATTGLQAFYITDSGYYSNQPQSSSQAQTFNADSTRTDTTAANTADDKITIQIRTALKNDTTLSPEAKNVQVIVSGGTVTLTGTVPTNADKSKIESIATRTTGVKNVSNRLIVVQK